MATKPQAQSGPFPGFSIDHFNQGMQSGSMQGGGGMGMGGGNTPPWEAMGQPMGQMGQDPGMDQALQQAISQTPGLAEAMQQDPQLGQYIWQAVQQGPQGGLPPIPGGEEDMQGMGGMEGMEGMDPMGGGQGPSPYGVMGDRDLINNPAYAGAAQTAHPKWNRFRQYMNTPEAKDSMMLGVIMSQMGTNPMQALQLAQQFRQNQTQRQFQSEQNQLNRESQKENIKLRSEYMKQTKNQASERTMYYKADQARKDLANLGKEAPPFPDDPAAMPAYVGDLRNQLATAQGEKKEKELKTKAQGTAFSQAHKTGAVPDEFADDQMVQSAAQSYNDRKTRADERLELQKEREAQLKTIRENSKTMKPEVALQIKKVDRKLSDLDRDINRYEQNIAGIEGNGIYFALPEGSGMKSTYDRQIQAYQDRITKAEESKEKLWEQWDALVTVRGEATPGGTPPPAPANTPIKDQTPGTGPKADGKYSNLTDNAPTPKAIQGFKGTYMRTKDKSTKDYLVNEWKRRYGTEPELP